MSDTRGTCCKPSTTGLLLLLAVVLPPCCTCAVLGVLGVLAAGLGGRCPKMLPVLPLTGAGVVSCGGEMEREAVGCLGAGGCVQAQRGFRWIASGGVRQVGGC